MPIKSLIRTIPDYPKPGVQFRDITTLLKDAKGLRLTVERIVDHFSGRPIDKVAGIEARGFLFGPAIALQLGIGFIPLRKRGKLPGTTIGEDYTLEYGTDRLEMHTDAVETGERLLLVDDLLATGGTALAAIRLIEQAGGQIAGCAFIVELPDLGGGRRIEAAGHDYLALVEFEGD